MKKLLLLLMSVLTLQFAHAQEEAYYKHALIISLGIGGDAYTITEKYWVNGYPNLSYTATGGAGCATYPFSVEYGLSHLIGLGVEAKVDNYIIKKDTFNNFQPTAIGLEYGIMVNFHLIRTHHLDFLLGLNLGGSNFTYTYDKFSDQVYGTGTWADIHVRLRYYFGRLGIYGGVGFPTMNYSLSGNNSSASLGQNILSTWKASGAAFSIGLQYRLFNAPGS